MSEARRWVRPAVAAKAVVVVVLAVLPLYLDAGYLQNGLFVMSAVVAAIGLTVLVGTAGQLSLAHAFFLAVGAYSYAYFAGTTAKFGAVRAHGLDMHPVLAAILAVLVAGVIGLLFSPIASRLRGIYLGVASLSLVFIGAFIYENVRSITGGFNGRDVPVFTLPGIEFSSDKLIVVAGVDFGRLEKLWELFLLITVLAYVFAGNVLRGRIGRAMRTMRDSELAAAVMGVDVRATKGGVFVFSSMYAGLGGVMVALAFGRVTPSYFDLLLSISFLAMIVIGGLGSIGGATLGAAFVTMLPYLLTRFSDSVPFVAQQGGSGYTGSGLAAMAYGVAVIVFVLFEPGGLSALGRRITGGRPVRALDPAPATTTESRATQEESA